MPISSLRTLAFAVGLSLGSSSFCVPTLHHLGYLGSDSPSLALGVSGDGGSTVGFSLSPSGMQAFRWRMNTGMMGLGDLPGGSFSSSAFACNANGTVVVGGSDDGRGGESGAAFMWTAALGMRPLGSLGGPTTFGQGLGVSDSGQVIVGQSQSPSGVQAFRWTSATGMVGLGDLAGGTFFSTATGVSGDGSVVCGTGTATGQQPFRWTAMTGMVSLDSAGTASGISRDGQVIVGASRGNAVRWTPQGKEVLFQTMDRTTSTAFGCSADGSIVVGVANYSPESSSGEAFIWDPVHGERSLRAYIASLGFNVANVQLLSAQGVSADGKVIVGYGDFGTGQEAWMLNLRTPIGTIVTSSR